jgi:hypothetical protein
MDDLISKKTQDIMIAQIKIAQSVLRKVKLDETDMTNIDYVLNWMLVLEKLTGGSCGCSPNGGLKVVED